MDSLTVAAVSGMKARIESLSLLSNNLANAASPGFKGDSEVYGLYTADVADTGQAPLIEHRWIDFTQGTLMDTGNETDFAIRGNGFFAVQSNSGEMLFTRDGAFHVSPAGELETQDGYPVLNDAAQPIAGLDPTRAIVASPNGELRQGAQLVGKIGLMVPDDATRLAKRGAQYFADPNPSAKPSPATNVEMLQGRLESANVAAPAAAVRLIDVLRQFESLQKALQIDADMDRKMDEVARVGG